MIDPYPEKIAETVGLGNYYNFEPPLEIEYGPWQIVKNDDWMGDGQWRDAWIKGFPDHTYVDYAGEHSQQLGDFVHAWLTAETYSTNCLGLLRHLRKHLKLYERYDEC